MNNLISRKALCDYALNQKDKSVTPNDIMRFPSAQPELPKQFMSDDCISRSELYKKVCEAEKLARERVLDTPSDSPFPNKLNPAYTRYSAQLDERTQFKHMIADARSVQPEQQWILCSERLPEEKDAGILKRLGTKKRSEYVLATVEVKDERMTITACTYDGKWDWNMKYAFPDFKVVAWMPLPEPYREERTEE